MKEKHIKNISIVALVTILLGTVLPSIEAIAATKNSISETTAVSSEIDNTNESNGTSDKLSIESSSTVRENKAGSTKRDTSKQENNFQEKSEASQVASTTSIAPLVALSGDPYGFLKNHLVTNEASNLPDLTALDWVYFQERNIVFTNFKFYSQNRASTGTTQFPLDERYRIFGNYSGKFILPSGLETNFTVFSIDNSEYSPEAWDSTFFNASNTEDSAMVPFYYPGYDLDYTGTKIITNPNKNDLHIRNQAGDILVSTTTDVNVTIPNNNNFGINWGTPPDSYGDTFGMVVDVHIDSTENGPEINLSESSKSNTYYQGDGIKEKVGDISKLFNNPEIATKLEWTLDPVSDQLGTNHGVILATGSNGKKTYINYVYNVVADQTAVNVHDSTIYVGDNWISEDNFNSALDKDGNTVDFSKLTVDDSQVDTTKAGTYDVTYSYDGITSTAKVTVKAKQTAVNVHDSTIYVGDNWIAEDNFNSALDKDGNTVDFSKLTVDDSQVDTTKAGTYDVTYSYDGITSTAKVTVKDKITITTPEKPADTISNDPGKLTISNIDNNTHNNNESKDSSSKLSETLPQTGEAQEIVQVIIGAVLIMLLGCLVWVKRSIMRRK